MISILVLYDRQQDAREIEQLIEERGLRCVLTDDYKFALDEVRSRKYRAVFVHARTSITSQMELAGALWESNPINIFLAYDLESHSQSHAKNEARLYGAEIAKGKDALLKIEKILESLGVEPKTNEADFEVLVVEDLDAPRDIICFFLESMGYSKVVGVSSGKEAMQTLQKFPDRFSCVVTDIRMPEMDGQELIKRIRAQSNISEIPIVVLTAHGTLECLMDCLKAGASGFLVKPPKKQDLQRELHRAMRIKANNANPRLILDGDIDSFKQLLISKGLE